ncbi:hypothetical protein RXV86_10210 [Alisedimentitalea sp. MJ-SS2]|uniref:hypothetical protein n=1 Tax=Aliisedimentitalea sp. MJ-SS2 TaxID=3049795 RepID=UPI002912891D|nr:hypothetical protein [Alisedimentitalea sp. MJ-SS2]MDU8927757.1 hypothetical protein [Alisedimentitalea sp. MJ-SS2]
MSDDPLPPLPDTPYWNAFQGKLHGFPMWQMLDRFWPVLEASGGEWFIHDLESDAVPDTTASAEELATLLKSVAEMYEPARSRSFCGVVFVDDLKAPGFVKLFDPWKMGASCGSSGERTLPRYVLSRIKPDSLPVANEEPEKPGLFTRIAGRG